MSLQFSYHFTRGDYIALSCALVKRPLGKRLIKLALWLAVGVCLLTVGAWLAGMPLAEEPTFLLPERMGGTMPTWFVGLIVILAITAVWPDWLTSIIAYFYFKRVAFGDQDYLVELGDDGINIRTDGASSHVDWGRLQRLIETRKHVVLAIGARQGACLPLRALPPSTDRAALIAYIKARTKPDLPHVR